jgi:hypothetical protein
MRRDVVEIKTSEELAFDDLKKSINRFRGDAEDKPTLEECFGLEPNTDHEGTVTDKGIDRRHILEEAHRKHACWHDTLIEIVNKSESFEEAVYLLYMYGRGVDKVMKVHRAIRDVSKN